MIHCQKCKNQNEVDAVECKQCGANLLPGEGFISRLIKLLFFLSIGTAIIALGFKWLEIDFFIYSAAFIGLLLILRGVFVMLRKTPIHQRYESRASRHFKLDPQQALNDLNSAIEHAPKKIPFSWKNVGKILGVSAGKAYNSLRGLHNRNTLTLKDTILSKPKSHLIARKLKFLWKRDKDWALKEMVTEIRLTEQYERCDSLRKALPNRLVRMGMKLGDQMQKDKVIGSFQDVQTHWIQYSYVVEANMEKLTGNNIVSGWEDGLKEGYRVFKASSNIHQQLGVERISNWRKKELVAIAYCYTCHTVVETGFEFDLNPKADCSEAMLQSISNCPVSNEHNIGWPIFVTPSEADEMKLALQHRMTVNLN